MISIEKTYLFLLAFMIFSPASLYAIDDGFDIVRKVNTVVSTEPQIVEAIENESIALSCGQTKIPDDDNNVKWFFNDILVLNQSKRKSRIDGYLHINYVHRNDSGYYRCVRSHTGKHNQRNEITNIIKLETIWLTAAEVVYSSTSSALDGHKLSTIILKCHVNGSPVNEIRWLKNGKPVKSIGLLVIRYPTPNDNGHYRCLARNKAGEVISEPYRVEFHTNNAHNTIHYAVFCEPKIVRSNSNEKNNNNNRHFEKSLICRYTHSSRLHRKRSASEGGSLSAQISKRKKISVAEDDSATMNCDVERLDREETHLLVRWKKDAKIIRQSMLSEQLSLSNANTMETLPYRDDGRINVDLKNGSITIASTIPSDAGIYECSILRNGNAIQSIQTTELNIIEKLKFTPPPSSKGLEIGSMGKIHCKVQGTPTPQIQWAKDSTNTLPDSVEDINGTLIFKNVSESDRGNYTCRASNKQGEISATVVITTVIAPKFLVKPQDAIQVNEMGSIMIHCAATGEPKPTIQWDKDFVYLNISNSDTSRLNVLDNGTLYFTEVHLEDEGLYGCTIGSIAGLKREEAHLTVRPSEEAISDDVQEGSFFVVRAVLITVTVVFSYIILVVGLMFWCRVKRKARKNRMQLIAKENVDTLSRNDTKPTEPNDENEPCLAERNHKKTENGWNGTGNGIAHNDAQTDDANNAKRSSKCGLDQITIPRTILFDVVQVGRGDFGNIYTAKVKFCDLKEHLHKDVVATLTIENERERKSNGIIENVNEIKEVSENTDDTINYTLVKALNKVKDENVCIEFRRQLDLFRAVSHRNVVKLFGLCRDKDPHYLVLEHTDIGDLKEFLSARVDQLAELISKNGLVQNSTAADKTVSATIKLPQILLFAQQITRGMDAIYRARYIHRDLAARNCVITSDLTVKISYPANIKDKYIREYYKLKSSMVPLRWMPPESIEDVDDNTIKSDVYSFGVLMLELFKFCSQLPSEQITDDDYLKQLQTNSIERELPDFLPDEFSKSLQSCWKTNPKERPSFSTLNSVISKYLQQIEANNQTQT